MDGWARLGSPSRIGICGSGSSRRQSWSVPCRSASPPRHAGAIQRRDNNRLAAATAGPILAKSRNVPENDTAVAVPGNDTAITPAAPTPAPWLTVVLRQPLSTVQTAVGILAGL